MIDVWQDSKYVAEDYFKDATDKENSRKFQNCLMWSFGHREVLFKCFLSYI